MKGDMPKVLAFETMLRGIEHVLVTVHDKKKPQNFAETSPRISPLRQKNRSAARFDYAFKNARQKQVTLRQHQQTQGPPQVSLDFGKENLKTVTSSCKNKLPPMILDCPLEQDEENAFSCGKCTFLRRNAFSYKNTKR